MKVVLAVLLFIFSFQGFSANLSTLVGAGSSTDDLKTKNAGTYNRDNHSLEALRERIDILEAKLAAIETTLTTVASDTTTIKSSSGSFTWVTAASDVTVSTGSSYVTDGQGVRTFTLPTTCTSGETIQLVSGGMDGMQIYANTGQTIIYNGTVGGLYVSGRSTVTVMCVTDNSQWLIREVEGAASVYGLGESNLKLEISWFTPSNNEALDGGFIGKTTPRDSREDNTDHADACAMIDGNFYCLTYQLSANSVKTAKISGITSPERVVFGANHKCVLETGGSVKCFGSNSNGQLGDGTTTNSLYTAVQVTSLTSGVTNLIAGNSHTCVDQNNVVMCWGANSNGQVGDNTTVEKHIPTVVFGMTTHHSNYLGYNDTTSDDPIQMLFTDGNHSNCAMKNNRVHCWGADSLRSASSYNYPRFIFNSNAAYQYFCDDNHCLVFADSTGVVYYTWGSTTTASENGLDSGLTSLLSVAGYPTAPSNNTSQSLCIVTDKFDLECYGDNNYGELGTGNTSDVTGTFIKVASGVKRVFANSNANTFCYISVNNGLFCAGNDSSNLTGTGIGGNVTSFTHILDNVKSFVIQGNRAYALTNNTLYTWGLGTLPSGTSVGAGTPQIAVLPSGEKAQGLVGSSLVALGYGSTGICLELNNKVYCWSDDADDVPSGTSNDVQRLYEVQYEDSP